MPKKGVASVARSRLLPWLLAVVLCLLGSSAARGMLPLPDGGLLVHPRPGPGQEWPVLAELDSLMVNGHLASAGGSILINGQPLRCLEDGRFADRIPWPADRLLRIRVRNQNGIHEGVVRIDAPPTTPRQRPPRQPLPLSAVMGADAVISASRNGSYWLFPEEGTRLPVTGLKEEWLQLDLGAGQTAWTTRSRLSSLEAPQEAGPVHRVGPRASCRSLENGDLLVRLSLTGDAAPLWQAEARAAGRAWELLLWNCESHLDWIRMDPQGGLRHLDWEPLPGGRLRLRADLEAGRYIGHDVRWKPGSLSIRFRARPSSLKDCVILLDPGHGGGQNGCIGASGMREKDLALQLAHELADRLRRKGAAVHLSRAGDEDPGLYDRVRMADSLDCDLLLSLHYDSVGEREDPWSQRGGSMFYWSAWSADAARILHGQWNRGTGLDDRGLHWRSLAVLRQHQRPALLLEAGTLIHPTEEMLLLDKRFRRKQVRALVKGIRDWLDS